MLAKILAGIVIALFLGKIAFRKQFKGLGQQLDRLVNATIAAFLIVYVAMAIWQCNT